MASRLLAILDWLNVLLGMSALLGMSLGVHKFWRLPLVGHWFFWTSIGAGLIVVLDLVYLALYGAQESTWPGALRICLARLVINVEAWYCMHWQFYRLHPSDRKPSDGLLPPHG